MRIRTSGFLLEIFVVLLLISSGAAMAAPSIPTSSADAGSDQLVDVNIPVSFDGSGSTGAGALEYTWFFRDGTVTTVDHPYPTHTYTVEGVYEVGLLVKDENGYFDFDTVQITVKNNFPVADAGSDLTASEDDIIDLDGSLSYDLNNDIVSYEWNFDDGTTATDAAASKVYENAGTYHVTLTVTDNDGAFDMDTITVTILNVEPTADGSANGELDDVLTVYEDEPISFDASQSTDTPSDAPHLKYSWDLGDGSKGYGITTDHTYTKQGEYYVTLRVTDDNDAYHEDEITIIVLNAAPFAHAGADQTVYEGDTVFFDAQTSYDTPSDTPLLDHSWSIQDQGTNPTYSWYDDSINDVELLLTDDDAGSDNDATTISILNSAPKASMNTAYIPVDFTLRSAGKKGNEIRLEVLEGSMIVDHLDLTDAPGNPDDQALEMHVNINIAESALARVHFTANDEAVNDKPKGASPVWVTLSFEDGTSTTLFQSFNVNKPDEWVWDIDLGEHLVGHTVHFQGTVYDPGTDDITVEWDFGDGTTISTFYPYTGLHPVVIEESSEHIFSTIGQLTMTFSAEDDNGGIGTDTIIVDSQSDSIYVDNVAPATSAASDKILVVEDEVLEFIGTGSDTSSDMNILDYLWTFGDGNTANNDLVSHSYETEGVYTILLKTSDDSGDFGSDHIVIQVDNSQPVAILNADNTVIDEDDTVNFDASNSLDTQRDIPKLRYAWDFGDGSKGYGITTSHVYTNCGVYTVTLTVQDDNGAVCTDSVQITVNNVIPYDLNMIAKTDVIEDENIFFTGSASDTPSDEPMLIYDWDFGDGILGQGRNPTHSYSSPGQYTVTLTVTDDDLGSSFVDTQIDVVNVNPVAYAGTGSMILYGPEVTVGFEGRGFDTFSDSSSLSYEWDLGGGVMEYTRDVSMTFSSTGVYEISLEVTDIHLSMSIMQYITIDFTLDSDGDMITDEYEQVISTNPDLWDTDSDNLIDYMEVYDYPTDPLVDDTDADALNDWDEITHLGLSDPDEDGLVNPIDWDSDGEWIIDGMDTHPLQYNDVDGTELYWDSIKVRNDIASGVSVVMYGGTCSSIPTISEVAAPAPVIADLGFFVNIASSCSPPFNSQIRIRYDDTALPSGIIESNLILYEWSPGDSMWKIPAETGVDTTHNFVWAKVTHFSTFAIMDASQVDSDEDGLKDLDELTVKYTDSHFRYNLYTYYITGTPLFIKNSRLQVQIPADEIHTAVGITSGSVALFDLGYNPGDFSASNKWYLWDGVWKTFVWVPTPGQYGVVSAQMTFYLYTPFGYNTMRIDTISKTDPFDPDTDSDSLDDGPELNQYYTDPLDPDTDNDVWKDGDEINKYYTDPKDSDTDDDGISDSYDYDPLVDLQLTVIITEILQHDWVDPWPWQNGDFFVKVSINGVWWTQSPPGVFRDTPHEYPNIDVGNNIPDNSRYVSVRIELWDDDVDGFPLYDADDKLDISRNGQEVDVTYDVKTGKWTGDDQLGDRNGVGRANGQEDGSYNYDADDCEIWFDMWQNGYDGDRLPYWVEIDLGTNPKVTKSDSDSDGMPDWFEVRYGLDRTSATDAGSDSDSDGLSNKKEYQIGTNPKLFEVNLRVSLAWDASAGYINDLKYGMKKASDYLFDVTDGYLYFRYIVIEENKAGWSGADIQVHSGTASKNTDHHWPKARVGGLGNSGEYITMPQYFDHDGIFGGSGPNKDEYYKTIAHEFGHYGLSCYDEYIDKNGKEYGANWLGQSYGPPSMMNSQYSVSEMSSKSTYDSWSPPSGFETTKQYHNNGGPCWETFFDEYKNKIFIDLDNNGVKDTTFLSTYSPIGGPGVFIDGPYVKFG